MRKSRIPEPKQATALVIKNYGRDIVYTFGNLYQRRHVKETTVTRGKISQFSYKSRRRCRLVLRNIAHHMAITFGLTYPREFPLDGRTVKEHLHALQMWFKRRGLGYFWIVEFQERGAPHFHGLLTGYVSHGDLAEAWNRIISRDLPAFRQNEACLVNGVYVASIDSKEKLASYFTEYMKKLEQKIVPEYFENVGRYWGFTRSLLKVSVESIHGDYRDLARLIRQDRRKYQARLRSWGIPKWKWRGLGYTAWGA